MNIYQSDLIKIWGEESSKKQEHAYRLCTQKFLEGLDSSVLIINEADSIKNVGKPDLTIKRKNIPIAYIEMKVLGYDLDKLQFEQDNNNQFERYSRNLSNFCISNNLEFRFFQDGLEYNRIIIGTVDSKSHEIVFFESKFLELETLLKDFINKESRTIKSANDLAKKMATKAKLIKNNALDVLTNNEFETSHYKIHQLKKVFKEFLIHDLDDEEFADMYSQTIVYGLFVARYSDKTAEDFSLFEAIDLIPKTNPFLKELFTQISLSKDENTKQDNTDWVIEELVTLFKFSDFNKIFENWGSETKREDPVVHFYETFLKEFDKETRKKRGVYYTPMPVVEYIVAFVDRMLKEKFEIVDGLASREEIKIEQSVDDARLKIKQSVPKVQVLDPATGTGTFLNEVIKFIYNQKIKEGENAWRMYVKDNLIKRLIGFELMVASYTIAHLKLGITLKETGVDLTERLRIYLTNTLEEGIKDIPTLFMGEYITNESRAAGLVKQESPIMVVIGNPPYSISSYNKSIYIQNLVEVYKKNLNSGSINTLSDDYVKFIRFSEEMISKNGEGIMAMITNNSFISGITHRQMRKHLLETFNEIYILNLSPENVEYDENVFGIKQPVSINIFIKKHKKKKDSLGQVFYSEMLGKRSGKFKLLKTGDIKYKKLNFTEPYYFFVPKDFSENLEYDKGFKVSNLFREYASGIKFRNDELLVDTSRQGLLNKTKAEILVVKDLKMKQILENCTDLDIKSVLYRPLDNRFCLYPIESIKNIIPRGDHRFNLMKNFINKTNLGLILQKTSKKRWASVLITDQMSDINCLSAQTYNFPLYVYTDQGEKTANLDKRIWHTINESIGAKDGETSPENILDYIYAVLHSSVYRSKFMEFLKIDFPKVPFPKDKNTFWSLVKIGERLRKLHLLDDNSLSKIDLDLEYAGEGNNVVGKVKFIGDKVYINKTQYFKNVPEVVWNFCIGGYEPARIWLKYRKEKTLNYEDIIYYQKIIRVLVETNKIMKEIDEIKFM